MRKKRLKVLCITDGIGPPAARGGEAIYDLQLRLAQAGVKVHILSAIDKFTQPTWRQWALKQESQHQIAIHYLNLPLIKRFHCLNRTIFKFLFLPATIRLQQKYKFDIIHEYASSSLIFDRLGLLKLLFQIPLVCSLVTYNVSPFGLPQFGIKGRWIDRIFVPSKSLEKGLRGAGFNKDKIRFLPLGMDMERFQRKRNLKLRKKSNLPLNKEVVLYLGPFNKKKGILVFLKAALKVLEKRKDVIFLIVSYREEEAAVKKKALSLIKSKQESFYFWDRLVDVPSLLAMIDIFVLPLITPHGSISPPITLLEAMAAGKPVVASEVPGVKEAVEDGTDGFLYPPEDWQALAQKILAILADGDKAAEMGEKERIKIKNQFNIKKIALKLLEHYEDLTG